ncbi:hypothetical protein ABPG75_006462 [Micractinium tetrahymenae]
MQGAGRRRMNSDVALWAEHSAAAAAYKFGRPSAALAYSTLLAVFQAPCGIASCPLRFEYRNLDLNIGMAHMSTRSLPRSTPTLSASTSASIRNARSAGHFVRRPQGVVTGGAAAATAAAPAPFRRQNIHKAAQRSRSKPAARAARLHIFAASDLCSTAADSSLLPPSSMPQPAGYAKAHAKSLSRTSLRFEQLMEQLSSGAAAAAAACADSEQAGAQLQRQRLQLEGSVALPPFQDAVASSQEDEAVREKVDAALEEWQAVAHQRPAGFDSQARLAVPGVADVAVVTRGGRHQGYWKGANQDAYSLFAPTPCTAAVVVADGHGRRGEKASRAAADGLAEALHAQLAAAAGGHGSGSAGAAPALQQALVAAFEHVGGSMEQDRAFTECGTAVVACLLQEDSLALAWAGDCRATIGVCVPTPAGPRCLVHPLTQDHKPSSPLERARIEASGRGEVVQAHPRAPARITGNRAHRTDSTLSLSRGFGDAWAVPLGLTAAPDAVTLSLPPPCSFSSSSSSSSGGSSPLDTLAGSSDADDATSSGSSSGSAGPAAPARHVLVLACDGLWDMVSNEEAVGIALSCESAEAAAHALAHAARRRWAAAYCAVHMDDITAAVAFLPC